MKVHLHVNGAPTKARESARSIAALGVDPMVETHGIIGTPQQCATKIQSRYGATASEVCCYFPGYEPSPDDIADLIAALQRIPAVG